MDSGGHHLGLHDAGPHETERRVGAVDTVVDSFDLFPVLMFATEGPDMVIVTANAAVRALHRAPEPIGRTGYEIFAGMAGQETVELIDRCYRTGEQIVRSKWRAQLDPSDPASEMFVNFVITPWRHPDGRMRGTLVHGFDVTAEVKAQQASEARAAGAEERLAQAQEVVLTLQRNLLPATVPILPRVRLAAQYVVAAVELQAGGDWFDAVPTGKGRIALVVGDVVGHGAAAAAAMAQLRTILYEALLSGAPISEAVDRLDRFAATTVSTRAATVCVAELDPHAGTLTWTARAHPPPLVCAPDGTTRFLPDGRGPALGVGAHLTVPATTSVVPGEVVLLYTDGLIERPGETQQDGLDRLVRIAGSAIRTTSHTMPSTPPDRVCAFTVERVIREAHTDDVTVLAAHLTAAQTDPLTLDRPAEPGHLTEIRDAITAWLTELDAEPADVLGMTLAAYEASANVVDHAYHHRPGGTLRLHARLGDDGTVEVTVADDGHWRPPGSTGGGRGLALIRAHTDVHIDRRPDGTTVTMRRRLHHPTIVGTTLQPADTASDTPVFETAVTRRDPTVVTIRGPVDVGTVDMLRIETIRHAGASLVLDLTPVTFLASAGVQALHELTTHHEVELFAPNGTPARQVLDLVGLDASPRSEP